MLVLEGRVERGLDIEISGFIAFDYLIDLSLANSDNLSNTARGCASVWPRVFP